MTDSKALTTTANSTAVQPTAGPDFASLVNAIAPAEAGQVGMVAASSARVYRVTFEKWETFAAEAGFSPLDINYSTARAFLAEQDGTKATKQRQLSALRKLAEVLAVLDFGNPARQAAQQSLKLLKVKHLAGDSAQSTRKGRALTPAEADKLLRVWRDITIINPNDKPADRPAGAVWGNLAKRNYALIAVLLLTGMRRAELAALTWQDIDFERGIVHIEHGKGDKERRAAMFGDTALKALKAWQLAQPRGYRHVFVGLRKGGHFSGDNPMTATAIYNVVRDTASRAGIGELAPHDLRRTLITELIAQGTPIPDVQAQAGHADSSTTLMYGMPVDAVQRRKTGKVRFG